MGNFTSISFTGPALSLNESESLKYDNGDVVATVFFFNVTTLKCSHNYFNVVFVTKRSF